MRLIIIFLLSLCQLSLNAHDIHHKVASSQRVSRVQANSKNNNATYNSVGNLSEQNEYVIDIEDDDNNDNASLRKYPVPGKSPFVFFQSLLFLSEDQFVYNNPLYHSKSSTPTSYRYITLRSLRI
ncbi:hypothetical protein GCM10023149_01390 [Mucilaginibacter gynuensis]|uniref:Uncharacterized protein n=1 Tax=Mucilaginibacter gynuensis TaxID=1302236 RepID=A0ABP8FNJ7_9SPHI